VSIGNSQGWPAEELETADACPVCGAAARSILHADLVDDTFAVAPGTWAMWRCAGCSSGYLSPRPNTESIHRAYSSYYTHTAAAHTRRDRFAALRWVRRCLSNGYTNRRYGSRLQPATVLGVAAAWLVPWLKRVSDRQFRHLPRQGGRALTVLDVGCGDGAFLAEAAACGWQVLGLEPDAKAAARAQAMGIDVRRGGLERAQDCVGALDAITLSHVIEHLHGPVEALLECRKLLRPGGQLWIETPNIDSLGHGQFGPRWRGIEAPRHLVLFNPASLRLALRHAGFVDIEELRIASPRRWMYGQSWALAQALEADANVVLPLRLRWHALLGDLCDTWRPQAREFITVKARRPP
jgi:2-polyprenyl-3-methyl-5-hydroxy-6-metoxy-1,4-benzoquinol methylase